MGRARTHKPATEAPKPVTTFGKKAFDIRIAQLEQERAASIADYDARLNELRQWAALCDSQETAQ